jgi:hypothetical protein
MFKDVNRIEMTPRQGIMVIFLDKVMGLWESYDQLNKYLLRKTLLHCGDG